MHDFYTVFSAWNLNEESKNDYAWNTVMTYQATLKQ